MPAQHLQKPPPRALRAEASAWLAKLHGAERSARLEADFREWLRASPEHARAFESVTEIWESLATLKTGGLPRLATNKNTGSRPARLQFGFAAAASLLIAICCVWLLQGKRYSTEIGEQRIVTFEDGSRVSLNSSTAIKMEYGKHRRSIHLSRGEALFDVAKDPHRPFVVTVGDRQVTALGTSFVVRYDANLLAVTLLDGKVAVAPLTVPPEQRSRAVTQTLQPGQRLTVNKNSRQQLDTPRLDAATAWRRGEVILDETPLGVAVAEMNRYERTPLTVEDSQLNALHVSGIYKTGDGRGFAQAVAEVYGLMAIERDGRIYLQAK